MAQSTHPTIVALRARLVGLVDKLIIGGATQKEDYLGCDAISCAIFDTIIASHLNTFDPRLSVQHRLDGNKFDSRPRRQKIGMWDFTSLSLFVDDVESLLRDLYGEVETEALDLVRDAVFTIVRGFMRYVRIDLSKEHDDAYDVDTYLLGIGLPEEGAISGSEWRYGMAAKRDLAARAREVRANPSAFSEYTVEFVKALDQHWPWMSEVRMDEDLVVVE